MDNLQINIQLPPLPQGSQHNTSERLFKVLNWESQDPCLAGYTCPLIELIHCLFKIHLDFYRELIITKWPVLSGPTMKNKESNIENVPLPFFLHLNTIQILLKIRRKGR